MKGEDELAAGVRAALAGVENVTELKMFGGVGFMLNGNLIAGASKRGLLLRVGAERQSEALARPRTRLMEARGRAMAGYVYVDPPPTGEEALQEWIGLALSHVRTLPAKAAGGKPRKRSARR
jgi:TfoX/Sxy family transcriptional regulator of competence genes